MKYTWKHYTPKFEYEKIFPDMEWPWAGHKYFAYDLIRNIKPKTIVELGTHKGTSFFSMCQAVKDGKVNTNLYAIDNWEGDKQAGSYDEKVLNEVKKIKNKYYSSLKIFLIKKLFDEAISDFKDNSIDVLHIDGLHTYEAVKHDFFFWLPKMSKNGIILFHDIVETQRDFGVKILWQELQKKYKTLDFFHSHGLGVLFLNIDIIFDTNYFISQYYSQKHQIRLINHRLSLRDEETKYRENEIIKRNEIKLHNKKKKILNLKIKNNKLMKDNLQLLTDNINLNQSLNKIQSSKTYLLWQKYNKIKNKILHLISING